MAGQENEGFSTSYREASDEHLLGEFARAGEIELALEEEAHIDRLEVEFLGDALHVVAIAGKPRLEIVDARESTVSAKVAVTTFSPASNVFSKTRVRYCSICSGVRSRAASRSTAAGSMILGSR